MPTMAPTCGGNAHSCRFCGSSHPSKTKLFQHLRDSAACVAAAVAENPAAALSLSRRAARVSTAVLLGYWSDAERAESLLIAAIHLSCVDADCGGNGGRGGGNGSDSGGSCSGGGGGGGATTAAAAAGLLVTTRASSGKHRSSLALAQAPTTAAAADVVVVSHPDTLRLNLRAINAALPPGCDIYIYVCIYYVFIQSTCAYACAGRTWPRRACPYLCLYTTSAALPPGCNE